MPYRRLPKTDSARLKALKTVIAQGRTDGIRSTIVSQKSQFEAQTLLQKYEQALFEYKNAASKQSAFSKKIQLHAPKARLYVSHFIQVLNLSVIRGEINAEQKSYYGLGTESNTVPDLSTDQRVVEWGRKIIKGEMMRQQHGGAPIYNPSIAKVRAYFDPFESDMEELKIQKHNVNRFQKETNKVREQVDEILLNIWNQVENAFVEQPLAERLESCKKYGLIYYYRRGETPIVA